MAFHDAEDAVAFSLQVQQALAQRSWGKVRATQHELSDLTGMRDGVFSARFSATQQSSINSTGVRSGSFGLMGEDSYSGTGQLGPAGPGGLGSSFTAGQQVDSMHSKINTSFTSSAGRASSGERPGSFSMPRTAPSEEGGAQAGALVRPAGARPPAANGPSKGAAWVGAAGGGEGSRHGGQYPDQRQVSFSDAALVGHDQPSPFTRLVQHPQQQQLLRMLHYNDEQAVQPSGNSGSSWPDDAAALTPANVAMKTSFDGYSQPGKPGTEEHTVVAWGADNGSPGQHKSPNPGWAAIECCAPRSRPLRYRRIVAGSCICAGHGVKCSTRRPCALLAWAPQPGLPPASRALKAGLAAGFQLLC